MKYDGPLQVRYVGNPDVGARFLHEARVLVGELIAAAAPNKLGVLSGQRELENGVRIDAQLLGALRQATIDVENLRDRRRPIDINDFVVTPRTASQPDGVDPEQPELVLRRRPEDEAWRTYFFDGSTPDYLEFQRPKAIFSPVFIRGLGAAGNIDWLGPEGERISWKGPQSRMFTEAYVHPSRQYGRKVYMLGQPILDTADYDVRSQTTTLSAYILGAALKYIDGQTYLITVQSTANNGVTDAPSSTQLTYSFPLAPQTTPGAFYAYRLGKTVDDAGIVRFYAISGSRRQIAPVQTGNCDPWFFNRSATEATCVPLLPSTQSAPGAPVWSADMEYQGEVPDPASGYVERYPGTDNQRVFAVLDGVATASFFVSTLAHTVGGAATPVSVDYVEDMPAAVGVRMTAGGDVFFVTGEFETHLYRREEVSETVIDLDKRWILYANIRDNVFVFQAFKARFTDGVASGTISVEVYRGGTKMLDVVTSAIGAQQTVLQAAASLRAYSAAKLGARTIAPLFFIYGFMIFTAGNPLLDPSDPEYLDGRDALYIGANASYGMRGYPFNCYFGLSANTPVSGRECGGFSGNRADDEGYFSITGVAATDEYCMLSTAYNIGGMASSLHWTNTDDLPDLTGVTGSQLRYHPLWLLGAVPLAEFIPEPGDPR